jgi:hypothetical protein
MNDVKEERWHVWNINIADFIFTNWDFDPSNVAKIIIGFGDGSQAASDGTVYFEDIRLYKEYPPPEHSAKVEYDGYPEYKKEPRWHVWNIPLAEFADVNLGNVAKIAIGFGDWTSPGGEPNGYGAVYFEDILLRNGPAEDIYYDGSVYLDKDPFVNGYTNWPLLLKQDCRLIDAGGEYIDEQQYLIGKTTAWEGTPDNNVADIGFHYFNWYYVNAWDSDSSFADLDDNNTIDLRDFAILADGWETIYDINDLQIMAGRWLWSESTFPDVVPSFDGDPNNIQGYVNASIDVSNLGVYRAFMFLDGKMHGEFSGLNEPNSNSSTKVGIDTRCFSNGQHGIKVVVMYDDSKVVSVVCSGPVTVNFNNDLHNLVVNEGYRPEEDYCLYGIGSGDYQLDINDCVNNVIVYTQNFQDKIQAVVTTSIFAEYGIYELTLRKAESTEEDVNKVLTRAFSKKDFPPSCNTEILISCGSSDVWDSKKRCVIAVTKAAIKKNMHPVFLSPKECKWDNLKYCLKDIENVKKWYHMAHGAGKLWSQPDRQCIETADGWVFSYLKRNMTDTSNYKEL